MRILLTGASGHLGTWVWRALCREGFDVRATDLRAPRSLLSDFRRSDLTLAGDVWPMLTGIDAVVHLANHASDRVAPPERLYAENAAMNVNVFQASLEAGVQTVIFASSIQAVAHVRRPAPPPYLPFDSRLPHAVGSAYSASKAAAEQLLSYYCVCEGLPSATALRFPYLVSPRDQQRLMAAGRRPGVRAVPSDLLYLRVDDAADLIVALLRKPGSGYRVFLPAAPDPITGETAEEARRRLFRGVPVRGAGVPVASLVDCSDILAEAGWSPRRNFEDEFEG